MDQYAYPRAVIPDFPVDDWAQVQNHISEYFHQHPPSPHQDTWDGLGGGWNGVMFRFCACAEAGASAGKLLDTEPAGPSMEVRIQEENGVCAFFAFALSAFESCGYAAYFIGKMLQGPEFQAPPGDVKLRMSGQELTRVFPRGALGAALTQLSNRGRYQELEGIRNRLLHRAVYGRTVPVRTVVGFPQRLNPEPPDPPVWHLNDHVLNGAYLSDWRAWVAGELTTLVHAARDFALAEFV